jgi:hypothetical protein
MMTLILSNQSGDIRCKDSQQSTNAPASDNEHFAHREMSANLGDISFEIVWRVLKI